MMRFSSENQSHTFQFQNLSRARAIWYLLLLVTVLLNLPTAHAQGLQDVGIFQAIDQFLSQTGSVGRLIVGLFAGIEGLGGITKDVHVEWDILRSLYSFGVRVESMVMVFRTLAQYNYVSPMGIFRCAEVPDSEDPKKIMQACRMHNRGVTVANAAPQYFLLCVGMSLISVICIIKKPFTEDTYFTATVAFMAVLFGGSVRVCRTEYTARRTVMELDPPQGWPADEDVLRSMMTGVDVQLNHVPGLFEQELMVARRAVRSGLKSIATLMLVQVGSIILWLGGSPWKRKWIAMGVAVVVGLISMVVNYVSATVSYLMRIEARDTRGIYECVAAVWLMMNGEKMTRPMVRYLQRSRLGWGHSSIDYATRWWRGLECFTAFMKGLMIINITLLGCGPPAKDLMVKIGFLLGTMLWVLAMYLNGAPF